MTGNILVLNAGSSGIKFSLYAVAAPARVPCKMASRRGVAIGMGI
jgi:acetate kinase